jgi:hypothetical protein
MSDASELAIRNKYSSAFPHAALAAAWNGIGKEAIGSCLLEVSEIVFAEISVIDNYKFPISCRADHF